MRTFLCLALATVLAAPSSHAAVTSYSGEAVVRSIAPTRVAVFLDTNGDKRVDNGFLLTTDIPMHGSIAVRFPAAQLSFTDGYLRVQSDKSVYDLQVAGYPEPPAAPDDARVVTLIGSALMHSAGDGGCDIQQALEKDAKACYSYGRD